MKALKYIIWSSLIFLGLFYFIPAGILQIPYFQEKISEKASEVLHDKLGTEVQIGRVNFEFFNKLILKEVYLEDQSGDTLFQAKRVAVGFEFLPLFKKKLRFHSAQIFSFQVNLNKENKQSPLNLQFVLDAFASRDTTKKSTPIDLQIQNLNLRRGRFSFRVKDTGQTPGKFNPNDLALNDISAKIHLHDLTNKQLIADISRLSFTEQSGMQIKRLTFDLAIGNKGAKIKQLELQFPRTILHLANIFADYSQLTQSDNLIADSHFNLEIKPSDIYLHDISPFVPILAHFNDKMSMQGHFSGTLDSLTLDDFYIRDNSSFMLQANANLINITSSDNPFISGVIHQSFISAEGIRNMVHNFNPEIADLPKQVIQLGEIRFNGEISGYLQHLTAYGIFNTDVGTLRADLDFGNDQIPFFRGQVNSDSLNLKRLMSSENYGTAVFQVHIDAKQDDNRQFFGLVDAQIERADFKGHAYENLNFKGEFTHSSFKGSLDMDNPEGQIMAEGLFDLKGKNSKFDFSAEVNHIQMDKLNWVRKYKNSELSFHVKANFTGDNIDNLIGSIFLENLRFSTENGGYYLDTLSIRAFESGTDKILRLDSDIAKGEVRGNYSFKNMFSSVSRTLSQYLPSLIGVTPNPATEAENNFSLNLTIGDTEEISNIFDWPLTLHDQTKMTGQYDNMENRFRIEVLSPRLKFKGSTIESAKITLDNSDQKAQLQVSATQLQKDNKKLSFSAQVSAQNDSLSTGLNWENNQNKKYGGTIALAATFLKQDGPFPLKTKIQIQPSTMVFNDSIWALRSASILIDSGKIVIDQLTADYQDQFIKIDGTISKNIDDQLSVILNKVNLEYIFQSLNIKALTFGGIATGFVQGKDLFQSRQLSTDLQVSDFSFNQVTFGNLDLNGSWDNEALGIAMKGHLFKDDTTQVTIDGMIYPVKEELSIVFDAQNTEAAFLRKYTDNIVQNLSGKLSGKLRLFGDLNNPTVEGDVFVKNGQFGVEFLNTDYTFTDSVKCLPDEIRIQDVNFYDKNGWPALANGYVKHKQFSDFHFSATFFYDNFLLFNATKKQNPAFYGAAYGTGSATIRGNESVVNIDVSAQNTDNTKISLNFMEEGDIVDYNFINFVSKQKESVAVLPHFLSLLSNKPILLKTNSATDIRFNLILEATPNATFEMIMDPISGDKISAYGKGNMQVQYGTKTPLKIFGNYTIEKGKYNFSFQQLFYRNFEIQEGSAVFFRGDPYTADLDIHAAYTVTANLGDLDQQLLTQSARNSVPVNCILNLTGPLDHPNIGFGIDLPGSNTELARQVKSYIGTEDMLNRQIVYLLVLGRFFTPPEYTKTDTRSNNDFSFLTSTLSTQLSNMLGTISEKIQVGTRFQQTYEGNETSTEVELLLSSQLLNNRLVINGNFGYIDNPINNENMPLVGDFDLEYKLTKTGDIRLKGYNHYNYRNYYSIRAEMTQGIGILFRKDFNTFYDLFGRKRKLPLPVTTPSDTLSTEETARDEKRFIQFKKKDKL